MSAGEDSKKQARAQTRVEVFAHQSAIGVIWLAATDRGLVRVELPGIDVQHLLSHLLKRFANIDVAFIETPSPQLQIFIDAIDAVLRGEKAPRLNFDLDVTDFEQEVLEQIAAIPAGATRSYQEIAAAIDRPKASRAVGQACGANPIPLLIPCHRVVGSSGSIVGFAGGLDLKVQLLSREGVLLT